jgi:hypothetical protein
MHIPRGAPLPGIGICISHLDISLTTLGRILAVNRLAQKAGWDRDTLAIELQALIEFDFEMELTGLPRQGANLWRWLQRPA